MSQTTVRARVRPARVAVLINRHGTREDFVLAVRFLSRLWGGMYAPILPTDPNPPDELTEFRLSEVRPDYVYSIGLDGEAWMPFLQEACQPRGYRLLDEAFLKHLHDDHREEHLTDRHLLNYLFRQWEHGGGKRTTRLIFWDEHSDTFPIACAQFGIPYDVRENPFAPVRRLECRGEDATHTSILRTQNSILQQNHKVWLELISQELRVLSDWKDTLHPTIVLVDALIEDLSLFWNLRIAGYEGIPRWVIPLPVGMTRDEVHAQLLKDWLVGFIKYGLCPNYVFVTSRKVPVEQLADFAQWLKPYFRGTPVKHVDPWPTFNRIPVAVPYESEELLEIRRKGRKATWLRPQSRVARLFGSRVSWMVDLVEDTTRRRSPFELSLPPRMTTMEILNSPNPPSVAHTAVPVYGFGTDSVNVRCTNKDEVISHWLPTERELLEELLYQHELRFRDDEKRACYLPALKLLGGLVQASSTLSGVRGAVLQELARRPATVDELKGRLHLGNGRISELNRDKDFELFLQGLTPTKKRVGRTRMRYYWQRTLPRDSKLLSLLEHWVSNGILRRRFRIGSCPTCQTTHHESGLNITRPYLCPGCGAGVPVPELLAVEYSLQPILEVALKQGLIPVALTGNFLRSLTRQGFLWLPGLKYSYEGGEGDIDVVASCDGHLVLAECKSREQSDPSTIEWQKILDQVKTLAKVGRTCRAGFVVLATMVDDYPQQVREEIEAIAGADLTIHLLSSADLTHNSSSVNSKPRSTFSTFSLEDFLHDKFPEVKPPQFDEPREFVAGGITFSVGGLTTGPDFGDQVEDPATPGSE